MAALNQEPSVNSGPKAKSSLAMVTPWEARNDYFIYATKQPSGIFSVTTNFILGFDSAAVGENIYIPLLSPYPTIPISSAFQARISYARNSKLKIAVISESILSVKFRQNIYL